MAVCAPSALDTVEFIVSHAVPFPKTHTFKKKRGWWQTPLVTKSSLGVGHAILEGKAGWPGQAKAWATVAQDGAAKGAWGLGSWEGELWEGKPMPKISGNIGTRNIGRFLSKQRT